MTIVALSTPVGNSAIGVIRLSGPKAHAVAASVFRPLTSKGPLPIKSPILGHVFDKEGDIDKCVLLLWQGPATFTGEHMAEFYCHGGSVLLQMVLNALLAAGATPAPAGEFTKRAFLHGKLDLAEGEAIIDMIEASSALGAREALRQANGALSQKIKACRQLLVDVDADIMAYVDYSVEGIAPVEETALIAALEQVAVVLGQLLSTCHRGQIVKNGATVCILGKPNVGKSTLMNALAGYERCIVTEIAGTTRDVVEHGISLGGLYLRLFDTAGIRKGAEAIEALGIAKSRQQAEEADMVLALFDGTMPPTAEDLEILALCRGKNAIFLVNKCDLYEEVSPALQALVPTAIPFSGKTGEGISTLEDAVLAQYKPQSGEVLLTSSRHIAAVTAALSCVENALAAAREGQLPDMLELDIRDAVEHLGKITGEDVVEDVLESIFSRFCVGK